MNIHEYQAKDVLKKYGVKIQEGIIAESPDKAVEAAKHLHKETGTNFFVIKAQIHAGGRGKGGGIKLAKSIDEVKELSAKIIGMQLVTPQTGPEGKKVSRQSHQNASQENRLWPERSEGS
jgi:succinyl-CoA synthetase beta subunit